MIFYVVSNYFIMIFDMAYDSLICFAFALFAFFKVFDSFFVYYVSLTMLALQRQDSLWKY